MLPNSRRNSEERRVIVPWLMAVLLGAQAPVPSPEAEGPTRPRATFLGPGELAMSPDGRTVYATLEGANAVAVVDRLSRALRRTIAVPSRPNGLCVVGTGLAVACGEVEGRVVLLDPESGSVIRTFKAGHSPRSPVVSADGRVLYVCNRFSNDVSVIDLGRGATIARAPMPREPYDAALTPDGRTLVVSNLLPHDPANGPVVSCQVALMDTATRSVRLVRLPNGATSARGVAITPDGRLAVVVHVLGRFMLPTSQVDRGWMNTNALSLIDVESGTRVATVLLDEVENGAANPWDVAVSPDGQTIVVSLSGTHELCVIDLRSLLAKLAGGPESSRRKDPRGYGSAPTGGPETDLSYLVGMSRKIALNTMERPWPERDASRSDEALNGPRGLVLTDSHAYVAVHFSGVVAEVAIHATERQRPETRPIKLGEQAALTPERRGERAFHDATLGFQGWQSCASCHPDGRADGLNWDLLNDGVGNPNNVKSLVLAHLTPPAMISGVRADSYTAVRTGFRHILLADPGPEVARDVDAYMEGLRPVPGPGATAGPAIVRGKALFEAPRIGCAACHPPPLYTDLKMHDVGSKAASDRRSTFDTPSLVESWRTAPYLHDGRHLTFQALLRDGRHGAPRGSETWLTDDQIDDLVAFLRSL
jgi:YVTN family beta-propeller protein